MHTFHDARLMYRLVFAVDVEKYSARSAPEQSRTQHALHEVLSLAAHNVDLDRSLWYEQSSGDGQLAVLPEDADISLVTGDFTREFASVVEAFNRRRPDDSWLRLRLALHHGTLVPGPFGPAGDAPIVVSRLLDATPLRRLLTDQQERDVAMIVSRSLFEDVVRTGFCSLEPNEFQSVRVAARGISYHGYLHQRSNELHITVKPPVPRAVDDSVAEGVQQQAETPGVLFEHFYRSQVHALVGFLIKFGADLREAEDAAQVASMAAWEKWERIRTPHAWVRKVAIRQFLRSKPKIEITTDTTPQRAGLLSVPELFELREDTRRVLDALVRGSDTRSCSRAGPP